jgi:hypothetical protein
MYVCMIRIKPYNILYHSHLLTIIINFNYQSIIASFACHNAMYLGTLGLICIYVRTHIAQCQTLIDVIMHTFTCMPVNEFYLLYF